MARGPPRGPGAAPQPRLRAPLGRAGRAAVRGRLPTAQPPEPRSSAVAPPCDRRRFREASGRRAFSQPARWVRALPSALSAPGGRQVRGHEPAPTLSGPASGAGRSQAERGLRPSARGRSRRAPKQRGRLSAAPAGVGSATAAARGDPQHPRRGLRARSTSSPEAPQPGPTPKPRFAPRRAGTHLCRWTPAEPPARGCSRGWALEEARPARPARPARGRSGEGGAQPRSVSPAGTGRGASAPQTPRSYRRKHRKRPSHLLRRTAGATRTRSAVLGAGAAGEAGAWGQEGSYRPSRGCGGGRAVTCASGVLRVEVPPDTAAELVAPH